MKLKQLWDIPVVKDLFWFFLLLLLSRGLWKLVDEPKAVYHNWGIYAAEQSLSKLYVKVLPLTINAQKKPFEVQEEESFWFWRENKRFSITPGCSGLSFFLYTSFLVLFFPGFRIKQRLLFLFGSFTVLALFRLLVLRVQMAVFLANVELYQKHFHAEAKYVMLTVIFVLWLLMLKLRKRSQNPADN